jgi:hypothetical protein
MRLLDGVRKWIPGSDRLAFVGIDLYRVSERNETDWGNPQSRFCDPQSTLPALLNRSQDVTWQLLSLLDTYDDAFIDKQQIPTLIREFCLLEEYCESEEERNWLLKATAFLKGSKEHVRFVGD